MAADVQIVLQEPPIVEGCELRRTKTEITATFSVRSVARPVVRVRAGQLALAIGRYEEPLLILALPGAVDEKRMRTTWKNGVLDVELPRPNRTRRLPY